MPLRDSNFVEILQIQQNNSALVPKDAPVAAPEMEVWPFDTCITRQEALALHVEKLGRVRTVWPVVWPCSKGSADNARSLIDPKPGGKEIGSDAAMPVDTIHGGNSGALV
jgi:hypothetical protein